MGTCPDRRSLKTLLWSTNSRMLRFPIWAKPTTWSCSYRLGTSIIMATAFLSPTIASNCITSPERNCTFSHQVRVEHRFQSFSVVALSLVYCLIKSRNFKRHLAHNHGHAVYSTQIVDHKRLITRETSEFR